jgi:hypothetical protein
MDGTYAGLVLIQQSASTTQAFLPSENPELQLDPLIHAALATNPPLIRTIP